jgi:hypothetical protein
LVWEKNLSWDGVRILVLSKQYEYLSLNCHARMDALNVFFF